MCKDGTCQCNPGSFLNTNNECQSCGTSCFLQECACADGSYCKDCGDAAPSCKKCEDCRNGCKCASNLVCQYQTSPWADWKMTDLIDQDKRGCVCELGKKWDDNTKRCVACGDTCQRSSDGLTFVERGKDNCDKCGGGKQCVLEKSVSYPNLFVCINPECVNDNTCGAGKACLDYKCVNHTSTVLGVGVDNISLIDGSVLYYSVILRSIDDGKTWKEVMRKPQNSYVDWAGLTSVAWTGTKWIAFGNPDHYVSEDDGKTWAPFTTNAALAITSIAIGKERIVAASPDGVQSSTDWVNWNRISTISGPSAVAYGDNKFMVLLTRDNSTWPPKSGSLHSSVDGTNWTKFLDLPSNFYANAISYSPASNKWVIVGNSNTLYCNNDGCTFMYKDTEEGKKENPFDNNTGYGFGVACSTSACVAVGSNKNATSSIFSNNINNLKWTPNTTISEDQVFQRGTNVIWTGTNWIAAGKIDVFSDSHPSRRIPKTWGKNTIAVSSADPATPWTAGIVQSNVSDLKAFEVKALAFRIL